MAPTFEAEPADLKAFLAAKDVELVIACLQEIFERDEDTIYLLSRLQSALNDLKPHHCMWGDTRENALTEMPEAEGGKCCCGLPAPAENAYAFRTGAIDQKSSLFHDKDTTCTKLLDELHRTYLVIRSKASAVVESARELLFDDDDVEVMRQIKWRLEVNKANHPEFAKLVPQLQLFLRAHMRNIGPFECELFLKLTQSSRWHELVGGPELSSSSNLPSMLEQADIDRMLVNEVLRYTSMLEDQLMMCRKHIDSLDGLDIEQEKRAKQKSGFLKRLINKESPGGHRRRPSISHVWDKNSNVSVDDEYTSDTDYDDLPEVKKGYSSEGVLKKSSVKSRPRPAIRKGVPIELMKGDSAEDELEMEELNSDRGHMRTSSISAASSDAIEKSSITHEESGPKVPQVTIKHEQSSTRIGNILKGRVNRIMPSPRGRSDSDAAAHSPRQTGRLREQQKVDLNISLDIQADGETLSHRMRPKTPKHSNKPMEQPKPQKKIKKAPYASRLIAPCVQFWVEDGHKSKQPDLEDMADPAYWTRKETEALPISSWYTHFFKDHEHAIFLAPDSAVGAVAVAIVKEKKDTITQYRALMRTGACTQGLVRTGKASGFRGHSDKKIYREILADFNPLLNPKDFRRADGNSSIMSRLARFEELEVDNMINMKFIKVGVLYAKKGDACEEDMFCNQTPSPKFLEFIHILGEEVWLKDWKKYAGGLDTTSANETGKSVFAEYEDIEVMFHVSTMLPHSLGNQQVDRKRHLGNDVTVIIFKDSIRPAYYPKTIRSQFNHIFIVVSPITITPEQHREIHKRKRKRTRSATRQHTTSIEMDEEPVSPRTNCSHTASIDEPVEGWKVAICAQDGVPGALPKLPKHGIFLDNEDLRKFLLQRCINGERAAIFAPAFWDRLKRNRARLLKALSESVVPP